MCAFERSKQLELRVDSNKLPPLTGGKQIMLPKDFIRNSCKKTANRVLVLVICSKSPENTRQTFLKKLNFFRHAYKSTSNFSKGNQKIFKKKKMPPFYCTFPRAIWSAIASSPLQFLTLFFFLKIFLVAF